MKPKICQFEGCKEAPLSAEEIQGIYARFEIPSHDQIPNVRWCHEHALQSAQRAYTKLCGETRITDPSAADRLARLKEIEAEIKAPANVHYPNSHADRVRRLAEIDASLREPTLEQREAAKRVSDLRAAKQKLAELEQYQKEHAPVSPRFLRYRYLLNQGVNPINFNL